MNKKAEKYSSPLIKQLMAERNPEETAKVRNRMILAAKIADGIKAKGWNKVGFAKEMGKEPSVITKWLSGTHNFTADTLTEIGRKLNIELLNIWSMNAEPPVEIVVTQRVENDSLDISDLGVVIRQYDYQQKSGIYC